MFAARPICRMLLWQIADLAWSFALLRAGSSIDIKSDIIAMTTNSSIKVNALRPCIFYPAISRGKLPNNSHYTHYLPPESIDNPYPHMPQTISLLLFTGPQHRLVRNAGQHQSPT
jgi:hypothetical protein